MSRSRLAPPMLPIGGRLLLLLDYDGTLAPLADHPSRALLPARTKRVLEQLAQQPDVQVAVVSGRALADVKRMVGLPRIGYVGNHGLEVSAPGLRRMPAGAKRICLRMKRIADQLAAAIRPAPGAWIEEKGLTLSLHWRLVPPKERRRFHRIAADFLAPYQQRGALRVMRGKQVIEIRPPLEGNKGTVIAWLRPRLSSRRRKDAPAVVYFGDDRTDEDAFAAVNRLGGVSVLVGRAAGATAARYRLAGPGAVRNWLEALERARPHAHSRGGAS